MCKKKKNLIKLKNKKKTGKKNNICFPFNKNRHDIYPPRNWIYIQRKYKALCSIRFNTYDRFANYGFYVT